MSGYPPSDGSGRVSPRIIDIIQQVFSRGPPHGYSGPPPGTPDFMQAACEYVHNNGLLQFTHHNPENYAGGHPLRPVAGKFDGPGSNAGSGTPNTQSPRVMPSTPVRSPQIAPASPAMHRPAVFPPGLGYDPAKPKEKVITNTRVELPSAAYALENGSRKVSTCNMDAGNYRLFNADGPDHQYPDENLARPGYSTTGRDVQVRVNQFKVVKWPQVDIYQYDVHIGNGAEKKGKVKAVWESKAVQSKLRAIADGAPWLWDGNKIAWSSVPFSEQRINVNFDEEKGRTPRGAPDTCFCMIRPTKRIRMAVLEAYLTKKIPFDNSVLEAINFLDHLWRKWPSEQYTLIKRSFYMRGATTTPLDNYVVALKGVYSSVRLCQPVPSLGGPGTGLAINVDVANGTFWTAQDVHQAARNFCGAVMGRRTVDYPALRDALGPIKNPQTGKISMSPTFVHLGKMSKLRFTVKHRGKEDNAKVYTIQGFERMAVQGGANAKNSTFPWKDHKTGREETISVFDFYRRKYNHEIQYWYLPLIETARDGKFPMELCTLVANQRFQYKLSPEQTQAMIKFAVTRPAQRLQSIQVGINMLKWQQDPNLRHYGVQIDQNLTHTKAKVLAPPEVQYDKSKATPGYSGRWDLRGKKFLFPNTEPLKSWGVVIVNECIPEPDARNFMNLFIQTYAGHGGRIENKNPVIYTGKRGQDLAELVVNARKAAGDQAKMAPQILFFILPERNSVTYERLKRNNECRFALVSQMMNINHVRKCQAQYCSNVAMKVNAKLGGASCKVVATKPFFSRPTMIIGSDVSHPAPGSPQPSMAALTMSFDNVASRYAAAVQTNGYRVEMITEANINNMLIPLFGLWIQRVNSNSGPQHIYYFRDGVSEGQFAKVINEEVAQMKKAIIAKFGAPAAAIKWTVIVCSKRHHIRIFPKDGDSQAGDRNGNPLPGTLVEHDVTHPFEYDFYLNSHSAIQGTARPVHYQVLLDEAQVPVNELQKLIYQHSYQYMRSTTPVSIFPAIYYAHLASNRARCHESAPASEGPRGGQKFEEIRGQGSQSGGSSKDTSTEAPPLLPLGNVQSGDGSAVKIRTTMWYI